jgi:hypothetical protein
MSAVRKELSVPIEPLQAAVLEEKGLDSPRKAGPLPRTGVRCLIFVYEGQQIRLGCILKPT